jgi:hypothetical protein
VVVVVVVVVAGGVRPVSTAFLPQPGYRAAGVGSTFRSGDERADVVAAAAAEAAAAVEEAELGAGCQSLDLRW